MNSPRLLAVLLALSLAGHAAWLWRGSRAPSAAPAATAPGSAAPGSVQAGPASGRPLSAETTQALRDAFAGGDLGGFRDLLVAAGVDPKLRKQLLLTAVQHHYEARFGALQPDYASGLPKEWWLNPDYRAQAGRVDLARMEAMKALHEEMNTELARLTGEDPRGFDPEENPWLARQFAGLPREKAEALHRIQSDYQDMEQEINMRAMGFQLPEDEEKVRLLHEERERDIAALLTPEERAEWELRASPTADRTRQLATEYRVTEEEYRHLYALQKAFDARFDFDRPSLDGGDIDWQKHAAAQEELQKQIRALVGEERYLAAKREGQQDYLLARSAVERLGLPAETADRIHGLRDPAAAESRRIAEDPGLGAEQKRAALARLAADTRAEVRKTLGPEAADAYFKRGGMRWLEEMAKGARLVIRDEEPDTEPIDGVYADPGDTLAPRGLEPIQPVPVIAID